MNAPDRTEAIYGPPDEQKVTEETDTRTPSTSIFTFNREDHTLGNMLRERLLDTAHVRFAAYKVPHPLVPKFILRVQTDGEITPKEAVVQASQALVKDLGIMSRNFTHSYELTKAATGADQDGQ